MEDHFLREIQQIQLIQKKLIQKLENAQNLNNPDFTYETIEDLDQLSNFTASMTRTLSTKKIEPELLKKLNHEFRTPLVPIKEYVEMLLSENFGKLSDEQKNRIRIVASNIRKLEDVINNLLTEKQINVIEKENQSSQSRTIKELEQEKMLLGKIVQHEEKKNIQLSRKHVLTMAGFVVAIGIIVSTYSLLVVGIAGQAQKLGVSIYDMVHYVRRSQ